MEPVIKFRGYEVTKIIYETEGDIIGVSEMTEEEKSHPIGVDYVLNEEKSRAKLIIDSKYLSSYQENCSGNTRVILVGYFSIKDELSDEEIEEYMVQNAVAILFPYVRMIVTTINSLNGEHAIVLPTINTVRD